jgi:hypothetical protein
MNIFNTIETVEPGKTKVLRGVMRGLMCAAMIAFLPATNTEAFGCNNNGQIVGQFADVAPARQYALSLLPEHGMGRPP